MVIYLLYSVCSDIVRLNLVCIMYVYTKYLRNNLRKWRKKDASSFRRSSASRDGWSIHIHQRIHVDDDDDGSTVR